MTLPTGDADQTIIWKLVVQMQQAQTDIETFKKQVTELKALIRQTAEETGSSFRVAAEVIEQQLDAASKSAKKSLAITRADLKQLQSELKALGKPTSDVGDTKAVARTAKQDEIKVKEAEISTIKQRIAETTATLNAFRQQSTLALSELNREARNAAAGVSTIGTSFASSTSNTEAYRQKVDALRTAIEQMKQKVTETASELARMQQTRIGGEINIELKEDELATYESELAKLEAELNQLTTTGQAAFQGVATATNQASQATASYSKQLDSMTLNEKVESLKQKMLELQQTSGLSLRQISMNLKQTFKTDADESIRNLQGRIKALSAELKASLAELAKPSVEIGSPEKIEALRIKIAQLKADLESLKNALIKTKDSFNQKKQAVGEATKQLEQNARGVNILGVQVRNLGDIFKLAFVAILGGSVIGILMRFVALLGEAVTSGFEFAKAIFQLEVGIRALRRAGVDIATKEMLDNLDELRQKFGVFATKELVEGAAQFVNLIRDMGFTKDQILELQNAVATLAVVNGRSMEDVQRTVALAISSGYTEGLQRLGVSINRLTIVEEANRLGFEGGYVALEEWQRALASANIIIAKTNIYMQDLAKYQATIPGQIEQLSKQWTDQKVIVGSLLIPLNYLKNKVLVELGNALVQFSMIVGGVSLAISILSDLFAALIGQGDSVSEAFSKGADRAAEYLNVLERLRKNAVETGQYQAKDVAELFRVFDDAEVGVGAVNALDKIGDTFDKFFDDIEKLSEESAKKQADIEKDKNEDLLKIAQDGIADRLEIERKYNEDLLEMRRDAAYREKELARELQRDLDELDIKLGIDIDEAKLRNQFDVAEVQRKFLEDVADAQEKYRQKELERERKFQEELLRLREDYLMDLEEALENRDARAVLRARRQYNLDKERAIRANELEKLEGKEGLQNELRDLAQRRDARLRELAFELQQRIAALQRQAQFEREEKQRQYQYDLEELRRKLQQEEYERYIAYLAQKQKQEDDEKAAKTKRLLKYEEEKKELAKFYADELAIIVQAMADQAIALGIGSEEMANVIRTYFGEGGIVLTIMEAYADAIEETVARLKRLQAGFASSFSGVDASKFFLPGKTTKPSGATGFASGGAVIARKPTEVTFGEVPELAIFAPLNQLDKLPKLLGGATEGGVGSPNGSLGIRISLTPGLEAEIIEQSMDKIANIMFEVQRQ